MLVKRRLMEAVMSLQELEYTYVHHLGVTLPITTVEEVEHLPFKFLTVTLNCLSCLCK